MELNTHVERLREQLAVAAAAGGDDARALAERLTAPLDAAVRLMLLEVLEAAAAEITRELAPGSVEVRLRGGEPDFAVTPPPAGNGAASADDDGEREMATVAAGEGGIARINVRLPEQLKARVEEAADREGLSVNTWLVRAAAAAVERSGRERGAAHGGHRYRGWAR